MEDDYDNEDGPEEFDDDDEVDYEHSSERLDREMEDDHSMFADPGGKSALRAATRNNPRNLPCPTCKKENRLTPADVARNYQCDSCADRDEGGGY
jgi:hypothetical protein